MKPKFLPIFEQCLEEGIRFGYNRAHKHVENPSIDAIVDSISTEIMNSLSTYFDLNETT